jgi:uncharacterized membrane protein
VFSFCLMTQTGSLGGDYSTNINHHILYFFLAFLSLVSCVCVLPFCFESNIRHIIYFNIVLSLSQIIYSRGIIIDISTVVYIPAPYLLSSS